MEVSGEKPKELGQRERQTEMGRRHGSRRYPLQT